MKFLADEGIEGMIVTAFREQACDVKYILEMEGGITDEEVLSISRDEDRILITRDKDFGELVFC